jgi:hypothetical protein
VFAVGVRRLIEQTPQCQMDDLAHVGEVVTTNCLLDQIVVNLDLDLPEHDQTIPMKARSNPLSKTRLTGQDAPEIPARAVGP